MRRTRGEIGLLFLFVLLVPAAAERDVVDFFPAVVDLCRGRLAPD